MHTAVLVIDVQHGLCEGPMHFCEQSYKSKVHMWLDLTTLKSQT